MAGRPPADQGDGKELRSKGLLPALGVGGAVYLVTGVVSLGTLALVGIGAGIGYGIGSWISDQYDKKQGEKQGATPHGVGASPYAGLPDSLQASLMHWQQYLHQRSGGVAQVPQQQLEAIFAEYAQREPVHAQNVQIVQNMVQGQAAAQGGGSPMQYVGGGAAEV
mmetsp:Transcript_31603/g.73703  ORF Transcript_31603/g.73703 Transcript_31603/m.73703 type:complete len:165 (+) Transcript_31603:96-590(+)|eukprot:CAMPEP_0178426850 /NCGR_PEP_ID=MMETSP0689_2-20121128/29443_1 /TAXON_ID=160604 /ORGANISM="Amphidinium massartii, Strain CS-259" /LENGTH=164 /DNA_ID=CAMNT_0020048541 /DNA_START=95 /DNA_END=589 /DNA_ORIENTATION=-